MQKKKKKIADANSKMTKMLQLSDKDFLGNHHLKKPYQTIRGMFETNEK